MIRLLPETIECSMTGGLQEQLISSSRLIDAWIPSSFQVCDMGEMMFGLYSVTDLRLFQPVLNF
jgi:hypothetical protein